jgi:hypothetical protein
MVVVGEGFSRYRLTAVLKNCVYCASLQLALGSPGGTEPGQYLVPTPGASQQPSAESRYLPPAATPARPAVGLRDPG